MMDKSAPQQREFYSPVPVNATLDGLLGTESKTISAPSLRPVVAGVKVMLMVQSVPGGKLAPQLWVSPKSIPEGMMSVMVNGAVPELVRVTVWGELAFPTGWDPKSSCNGASLTVGASSTDRRTSWAPATIVSRRQTV
jgi:hypothetical protein